MSFLSRITGRDAARHRNAGKQQWWAARGGDPNDRFNQAIVDEGAGGGWEDAFQRTAGSVMNRALPQLRDGLQMTREDMIRRGVSTGDMGVAAENDLVGKWGQNVSDTLGGMAMSGYENNRNRYLDLLSGRLDRNTASKNARNQMISSGMNFGASAALAFL